MSKSAITLEAKNQDKPEDSKRPQNLRANAMPTVGYVLSVDGKLKTHFDNLDAATAAGAKLKQSFPVIQVRIYDATAQVYTPVEAPEPAREK